MKTLAMALILTAGSVFVGAPAECTYCPTYTCYSPCISGCVCISQPGSSGGKCYGVQHAERLMAAGAGELK